MADYASSTRLLRDEFSYLPEDLVSKYAEEKEFPVEVKNKEKFNCEVIETSLLAEESVMVNSSDTVRRSLIRHDPDKLALSILSILKT